MSGDRPTSALVTPGSELEPSGRPPEGRSSRVEFVLEDVACRIELVVADRRRKIAAYDVVLAISVRSILRAGCMESSKTSGRRTSPSSTPPQTHSTLALLRSARTAQPLGARIRRDLGRRYGAAFRNALTAERHGGAGRESRIDRRCLGHVRAGDRIAARRHACDATRAGNATCGDTFTCVYGSQSAARAAARAARKRAARLRSDRRRCGARGREFHIRGRLAAHQKHARRSQQRHEQSHLSRRR